MQKIQDSVLTSKEKKKRERATRKGKGRVEARSVEKIVNLSLSDLKISNRRKVILGEPKRTREVVKKLGLSMRGDERDVIEETLRLEGE